MAALEARARSVHTRIDMHDPESDVRPPLTKTQHEQSVDALGFAPHRVLIEALTRIGNGGFGPGYGLLGLVGGATNEDGETAVDLYAIFTTDVESQLHLCWPRGLLPIGSWGCAMYACVDCTTEAGDVALWEPNVYEDGHPASSAILDCGIGIETWLQMWANGDDVWKETAAGLVNQQ